MGSLWIKEFTGGLDTRRLPETTSGGVLLQATDGHITRGGEFEKRAAFIEYAVLPAGTFGLFATYNAMYVFGGDQDPGVGPNFQYVQLVSDQDSPAVSVLGVDTFAGDLFVAAQAADGSFFNEYGGTVVTDFVDGHATASNTIAAGVNTDAVPATAYFIVTGGTNGDFNFLSINGVQITSGNPISITAPGPGSATNNMAQSIADDINSVTSNPDYTATVTGDSTVTITAVNAGAATNGFALVAETTGDITYSGSAAMYGGADAQQSTFGVVTAGVSLTGGQIPWQDDNDTTCDAIVTAINARSTTTGYRAVSAGGGSGTIQIIANSATPAPNGNNVYFNAAAGGAWAQNPVQLSGGRDTGTQPGSYVLTLGAKVYVASGPDLLFSGVDDAGSFGIDTTGSGFIDMSAQASGTEYIYATARYQKYMAIFAARQTQIWYMDPDPDSNQQLQVLYNTGTYAPHSVVAFGDNDVFYLDESGIRSLRARDASLSATTDDVGVPIDTLIIAKLRGLTLDQRKLVRSVVEPTEGRVWISIIDTIYVFSYFAGAKVSAWSTYIPGFNVDEMVAFGQRVYLRSGNTIYVYGGTGDLQYDDTVAVAQIPYQDGGKPTITKTWTTLDVAVRGTWDLSVATDPTFQAQSEAVMTATQTTYNSPDSTMEQRSTHCSVIARSRGDGYALLGSIVLGYEDGSGTRPGGGAP